MRKTAILILFVILLLLLGAWVSAQAIPDLSLGQRREETILPVDIEHAVGQTITAAECRGHTYRFKIHSSKKLWHSLDHFLLVEVRSAIDRMDQPLVSRRVPLGFFIFSQYISVQIPDTGSDLMDGCYFFFQSNAAPGVVGLHASLGEAYPGGTLVLDGNPVAGDLAFAVFQRLGFKEIGWRTVAVLPVFIKLLGLTALLIFLGWGLLAAWGQSRPGALLGLVTGVAIIPLLMALFSLVGLPFTPTGFWLCAGVLGLAAAVRWILQREQRSIRDFLMETKAALRGKKLYAELAIAGLFVLALWVRLLQTVDLPAPPWVDAFFHAYLLQGFEESGKIPLDLNYPFGFHVLAYVHSLLAGWSIPQTLLYTGQWLSVVSGLAFYALAEKLLHRKEAAVAGAVLFWFYAPFPAYLVNWSRFPILMGMVLVCGFLVFWVERLDGNRSSYGILALIMLAIGMTHYASLVFVIFWGVIWWGTKTDWDRSKGKLLEEVAQENRRWKWAWLLLLPVVLFLLSRAINLASDRAFSAILAENRQLAAQVDVLYYLRLALQRGGIVFWLIAIAGGVCLFHRQRKDFQTVFAWSGGMAIFIALQLILLGGSFPGMNNLFIWFFIPAAIAGGYGLAEWAKSMKMWLGVRYQAIGIILVVCLALCGAWGQIGSLNPGTVLAMPADGEALAWAGENIPADSIFLVNAFAWGQSYQPSDGGGWLPYWGDFEICFPETVQESENLPDYMTKQGAQYWYQGQGQSWYDGDLVQAVFKDGVVLFDNGAVRILQLPDKIE